MVSWHVDVKYVFMPNWIPLDPLPCARKLFWLRSRVRALKILDQIQNRTERYEFALVCTGPKFFIPVVYPYRVVTYKKRVFGVLICSITT